MPKTEALAPHLPHLRRFARAITGSQSSGDSYVKAALAALASGAHELPEELSSKIALYRVFHAIWTSAGASEPEMTVPRTIPAEERLRPLDAADRAALLLTAVEGFNVEDAAVIMDITTDEVESAIMAAQDAIDRQLTTRVLIIEDESIIALDLEGLVTSLGHQVVASVTTKDEAVAKARAERPGLILADINLGEGGSGLEAASEILTSFDTPVIFITAYPERLLTGERPEPTYLVTKPFLPETVQATIGQALFFHCPKREAA
jgi:CheY-like chemotaxis protein